MLLTVKSLGLAVGFSLSQMGIIISTLGGIFILGERKTKKSSFMLLLVAFSHFRWYPFRVYENSLIAVFQPKMGRNFNGFVS